MQTCQSSRFSEFSHLSLSPGEATAFLWLIFGLLIKKLFKKNWIKFAAISSSYKWAGTITSANWDGVSCDSQFDSEWDYDNTAKFCSISLQSLSVKLPKYLPIFNDAFSVPTKPVCRGHVYSPHIAYRGVSSCANYVQGLIDSSVRRRGHSTTVDRNTWSIMQMRRCMLLNRFSTRSL